MSKLVILEILQLKNIEDRIKAVEFWIDVADVKFLFILPSIHNLELSLEM